jgi:glycosyltransferase involved in cell wall biosynthesis
MQLPQPVRKRIMILTPVYNEETSLPLYEQTVRQTLLAHPEYDFRILLIDDGSDDRSWPMILDICARDPHFQGMRLSRNYGSHIALSAGFAHADGDAVAILACDLQDPPEVILEFAEKWHAGAQIVWGRRRSRADEAWRRVTSYIFFKLMRRFAMPKGSAFTTGSFFLIDRKVAECFRQFQEHNRLTFALVAWTGFEQAVVEYNRQARIAGMSGWNFCKMLKTMYDAFLGFSTLPIRLMTLIGVSVFILTALILAYVVISWLTGETLPGWTSVMFALTLFFGLQFLLMGMVGEYLYRIYAEVVRRPLYFISERSCEAEAGRMASPPPAHGSTTETFVLH